MDPTSKEVEGSLSTSPKSNPSLFAFTCNSKDRLHRSASTSRACDSTDKSQQDRDSPLTRHGSYLRSREKGCSSGRLRVRFQSITKKASFSSLFSGKSSSEVVVAGGVGQSVTGEAAFSANSTQYKVENPLGSGATATVYHATYTKSTTSQTSVAIKVLNTDAFSRNQIEELRTEIQIMSLCRHPNVLPVHTAFMEQESQKLWIVTPLMSAGSCADILEWKYNHGMPEFAVRAILGQALKGLEYLHKCHLVHRDIKAANLLLDRDTGVVRLADFGVSSSLSDSHSGSRRNFRTSFVGTPCWMAPEVVEQSRYDAKADIWSLGITALELLTGRAPYARLPPMKVFMMTLQADPPELEDWKGAPRRYEYGRGKVRLEPPFANGTSDSKDVVERQYSRAAKDLARVCLKRRPQSRPTSSKLLKHSFFTSYSVLKNFGRARLVQELGLKDLPSIEERANARSLATKQRILEMENARTAEMTGRWDFGEEDKPDATGVSESGIGSLEHPGQQGQHREANVATTKNQKKSATYPVVLAIQTKLILPSRPSSLLSPLTTLFTPPPGSPGYRSACSPMTADSPMEIPKRARFTVVPNNSQQVDPNEVPAKVETPWQPSTETSGSAKQMASPVATSTSFAEETTLKVADSPPSNVTETKVGRFWIRKIGNAFHI